MEIVGIFATWYMLQPLEDLVVIWFIVWSSIFPFWCVVPSKIWQPCRFGILCPVKSGSTVDFDGCSAAVTKAGNFGHHRNSF
jgi:hypothetical protein